MKLRIFGTISMLIGVLIAIGFLAEFLIIFNFDWLAILRTISAGIFIVIGYFLFKEKDWARIGFLLLLGANAVYSLCGIYFFSFPLTIVGSHKINLFNLLIPLFFAWLPLVFSFFFLRTR